MTVLCYEPNSILPPKRQQHVLPRGGRCRRRRRSPAFVFRRRFRSILTTLSFSYHFFFSIGQDTDVRRMRHPYPKKNKSASVDVFFVRWLEMTRRRRGSDWIVDSAADETRSAGKKNLSRSTKNKKRFERTGGIGGGLRGFFFRREKEMKSSF